MNSVGRKPRNPATLKGRLENYSLSANSAATVATLKQRMGNWPAYAAVTGSALAMATTASAGIIYSGPLSITASPPGTQRGTGTHSHKDFKLGIAPTFQISFGHAAHSGVAYGGYNVNSLNKFSLLHEQNASLIMGHSFFALKKLSSGQVISANAGRFFTNDSVLKAKNELFPGFTQRLTIGEWVPGQPAFEGFRFATSHGLTDYGWAELKIGADANGYPDSVTLLGMAYNSSGGMIEAGQTSGAPEPGTAGLMLLALGAAGVTVLRRMRQIPQAEPNATD